MCLSAFIFVYVQLFQGVSDIEHQLIVYSGVCDGNDPNPWDGCNCQLGATGTHKCTPILDKSKLYVGAIQTFPMFILGMLLTLPTYFEIALEKGIPRAFGEAFKQCFSGSPLFFMFHLLTKLHMFMFTLFYGGSKYIATGRGFVLARSSIVNTYRRFAISHFHYGFDLTVALLIYAYFCEGGYVANMWTVWLIVVCWFMAPIWFNPYAFDWDKTVNDFHDWKLWLRRENNNEELSWIEWHRVNVLELHKLATPSQRFWKTVTNMHYLALSFGAVVNMKFVQSSQFNKIPGFSFIAFGTFSFFLTGMSVSYHLLQQKYRLMGRVWSIIRTSLMVFCIGGFVAFLLVLPPQESFENTTVAVGPSLPPMLQPLLAGAGAHAAAATEDARTSLLRQNSMFSTGTVRRQLQTRVVAETPTGYYFRHAPPPPAPTHPSL